jgi:hypothetical protein
MNYPAASSGEYYPKRFNDFKSWLAQSSTFPKRESLRGINESLEASYRQIPKTPSHNFFQRVRG